mgnify:CR=1 FL=1
MESKAQVRKVASGELDAVQVEFDTEIAEWSAASAWTVCGGNRMKEPGFMW